MEIFKYLTKRDPNDPKVVGCTVWERCEPDETSRVELIVPNDLYFQHVGALESIPCIVRFESNVSEASHHTDVHIHICRGVDEVIELMKTIIIEENYYPINLGQSD